jgi:hypothetical protein
MNKVEEDVLRLLRQLEQTVRGMAASTQNSAGAPGLKAILLDLDRLTAELPKGTDPRLAHYMHNKSYEKARLWLEGRDAENRPGTCR